MMKWVEISGLCHRKRFEALSQVMSEAGVPNEVEFWEVTPDEFVEKLQEAQQKFDEIRIGAPFGHVACQISPKQSAIMTHLRAADFLHPDQGTWWTGSALYDAFVHVLTEKGHKVDIDGSVLVVGAGASARVAVGAFARAGIRSFSITNRFDEEASELIRSLKRVYLGLEFNVIPKDQLILLPGTNGVLVNTTPFTESNEILPELYYFNFLKRPGLVWDLSIEPFDTPLIREAQDIGIETVRGDVMAAWTDAIWFRKVTGKNFDREAYQQRLL